MTIHSDRKAPTLRRLKRRKWLKIAALPVLGALIGVALRAFAEFQPVEAFLKLLETVWSLITDQQSLQVWIADHPTIRWIIGWVAAPTVLLMLAAAIGQLPPIRWLVDLIFPDPPAFVFADLDVEREATMVRLDRSATPLIGRSEELAELATLLDKDSGSAPFRWRMLSGPSGIGKTRLAIEWLEQAKAKGWDFGIIDPEDAELLKGWRARRPTSLVIDEARSAWPELERAIARLQSGGGKGRPVRVLVVAQIAPYACESVPEAIMHSEVQPALTLSPLVDEDVGALAAALDQEDDRAKMIVAESGGRPRAAIILANATRPDNLTGAMKSWAFRVVPELRSDEATIDESLAIGLIASGLAGPLSTKHLEDLGDNFSVLPLLRFFPSTRQVELERTLPVLLPEDLGQELAMRLLPKLGPERRGKLIDLLIECAPAQMEASLGSIWHNHPHFFDEHDEDRKSPTASTTLKVLQSAFDIRWSDRVDATRQLGEDIVNATAKLVNEKSGFDFLERQLLHLQSLISSRPFDFSFNLLGAKGAVNATRYYGEEQKFEDLERWGARLIALVENPRFSNDPEIRLEEAKGTVNAIASYGSACMFEDLERWGARLIALAENPEFSNIFEIRRCEAMGAANALRPYGVARKFEDLERWGARLIALAENPEFSNNSEIRLEEAKGFVFAIEVYGEAWKFEDLERWGARLTSLTEISHFSNNSNIRREEARGAINAILFYGQAKKFEDLERWGGRFIALTEISYFTNDPEIRLCEAMSAVNAMSYYGEARMFGDLERWGARLTALTEISDFSSNSEIRRYEAMGAANALNFYGLAQKFEDLERWGARLIELAENSDFSSNSSIRYEEARGAVNAMNSYSLYQKFKDLERWGARLIALAENPEFTNDSEIRYSEAKGAHNALTAMYKGAGPYNFWRGRMAKAALTFPYHDNIQSIAKDWGVDFMEQRSRGWPFGRGNF